jgi:tubulin beta
MENDVIAIPYNPVLSLKYLTEYATQVMVMDNSAFYNICFRTLKLTNPTYSSYNFITALAMSGITASLRFP